MKTLFIQMSIYNLRPEEHLNSNNKNVKLAEAAYAKAPTPSNAPTSSISTSFKNRMAAFQKGTSMPLMGLGGNTYSSVSKKGANGKFMTPGLTQKNLNARAANAAAKNAAKGSYLVPNGVTTSGSGYTGLTKNTGQFGSYNKRTRGNFYYNTAGQKRKYSGNNRTKKNTNEIIGGNMGMAASRAYKNGTTPAPSWATPTLKAITRNNKTPNVKAAPSWATPTLIKSGNTSNASKRFAARKAVNAQRLANQEANAAKRSAAKVKDAVSASGNNGWGNEGAV